MRDEDKSKDQLIDELRELRGRLSASGDSDGQVSPDGRSAPRSTRRPTQTKIDFVASFSLVQAQGVDVSEHGICFETTEDLQFEMEFELDGQVHQHTAHPVWMRRTESGTIRWGFELSSTDTSGLLSMHKLLDVPEIEMPEIDGDDA